MDGQALSELYYRRFNANIRRAEDNFKAMVSKRMTEETELFEGNSYLAVDSEIGAVTTRFDCKQCDHSFAYADIAAVASTMPRFCPGCGRKAKQ